MHIASSFVTPDELSFLAAWRCFINLSSCVPDSSHGRKPRRALPTKCMLRRPDQVLGRRLWILQTKTCGGACKLQCDRTGSASTTCSTATIPRVCACSTRLDFKKPKRSPSSASQLPRTQTCDNRRSRRRCRHILQQRHRPHRLEYPITCPLQLRRRGTVRSCRRSSRNSTKRPPTPRHLRPSPQ